jgi:hypothetical protein
MAGKGLAPAFYLHCEPCREPDMDVCVQWLAEQLQRKGGDPIIITPVLRQAEQVQAGVRGLSGVLGASISTYRRTGWHGGPVLAVWPDKKILTALDDDYRITAICAVPWALSSVSEWIRSRRAIDLLGKAQTAAAPKLHPVVEEALKGLTVGVNLGTALSHPTDKAMAVGYLRMLHRAHYALDPDEILAWAMGHGWSARGAQELAEVARGVAQGRAFRVEKNVLRPDAELLAVLKERVAMERGGSA